VGRRRCAAGIGLGRDGGAAGAGGGRLRRRRELPRHRRQRREPAVFGKSAATQSVTVTDTGTSSATISGVSVSGDYSETNNCATLAVNASCTVTVTFTPTATGSRTGTLTVTSNADNSPTKVGLTGTGASSSGTPTNLALNEPITASSHTQNYVATNANDGNTSTYWESSDGVWPSTLTVNLGAAHSLSSVIVDLPPSTAWQTRTQTFSILGSTNDTTWTTLAASATYTFNPSTGNTVTINLPSGTSQQYIELDFTANSVQNGAQVSELDVMGT
jgi:F5/8 type C domain/Abnormal spindle-like microcephaly-assoc'd, ASPM-SPD-2-Hydin